MAVAAAIGVGTDDTTSNGPGSMPGSNNALSQRLSNKMKMMSNPHPAALGDINRSIEKMSIGTYTTGVSGGGGGGVTGNQHCGMPPQNSAQSGQTMPSNANRYVKLLIQYFTLRCLLYKVESHRILHIL